MRRPLHRRRGLRTGLRCAAASLAVGTLLLGPALPTSAEEGGSADPGTAVEAAVVQTVGEGDRRIYVVRHGDTWSMHAENVTAENILLSWQEAGGPKVEMKSALDYLFTLSVHRLPTERIVARILEGYGYTLHYDAAGKLVMVRIYSPKPSRYPASQRLVESLGTWMQVETAKPSAAEPGAAPDGNAAPLQPPSSSADSASVP
jgi:hypothetical protein